MGKKRVYEKQREFLRKKRILENITKTFYV